MKRNEPIQIADPKEEVLQLLTSLVTNYTPLSLSDPMGCPLAVRSFVNGDSGDGPCGDGGDPKFLI